MASGDMLRAVIGSFAGANSVEVAVVLDRGGEMNFTAISNGVGNSDVSASQACGNAPNGRRLERVGREDSASVETLPPPPPPEESASPAWPPP